MRQELKQNPWFLMRFALDWGFLDENLTGHDFLSFMAESMGQEDKGILMPRGFGKTTPMMGVFISLILNDPNIALLQITRTEDNANKFGATVAEMLIGNDTLQRCFGTAHNKGDNAILPSSISECRQWGYDGYTLPHRKPRADPTFGCISSKAARAGKHPDIIYLDDLTEEVNNKPEEWAKTCQVVNSCWMLLPPHGFFIWTGTRWNDGDPIGIAEAGKLKGKQGKFRFLVRSCYIGDDPAKGTTYPKKTRFNMSTETGYTMQMLDDMNKPEIDGGLGRFFAAQMRNNPKPTEDRELNPDLIEIYEDGDQPDINRVVYFGIETAGGGAPIYQHFKEYLSQNRISMPHTEIVRPPKEGPKHLRIVAGIEPIITAGRLKAQKWMIGDETSRDNLGHEMRRLGVAAHDDIVDALHNAIFIADNAYVKHDKLDVYIATDLAWADKKKGDYIVALAIGLDKFKNVWIIDYDRFRTPSPTGIALRLYEFYRKFEVPRQRKRNTYPGAWQ